MAESPKHTPDGCGLVGTIFRGAMMMPNKPSETKNSLPVKLPTYSIFPEKPLPKPPGKPHKKTGLDGRGSKESSFFKSSSVIRGSQVVNPEYTKRMRREPTFKSGDFSVTSHRRSNASGTSTRGFYEASANSAMLLRELGNLNQKGKLNPKETSVKVPAIGNILRKQPERNSSCGKGKIGPMANKKMDPDSLKCLGNDKFKEGKFQEALDLYTQAISRDPNKASFYSNKSAALMSLGLLMEAIIECSEAIKLDPYYRNAHNRMARLYIRLGEAGKAIDHYEISGRKFSNKDISLAEQLQRHVHNCFVARRQSEWDALLNECQKAVNLGADSAPQIYAMRAEALMELRRHEEAYKVIEQTPNVNIEHCTKFLGTAETAKSMIIRSRVYLTLGKFDDAVALARQAEKIDTSDELHSLAKRVESVASLRMTGNRLFNSSRFTEACLVYTSALGEAPNNSILLCNRAACRAKLGKHEKSVEDCTSALYVRPSNSKARMRRADSNVKLERWEAALKDYETLMQEVPRDEDVRKGYTHARKQVQKQDAALKNEIVTAEGDLYNKSVSFKTLSTVDVKGTGANCAAVEFDLPITTLH